MHAHARTSLDQCADRDERTRARRDLGRCVGASRRRCGVRSRKRAISHDARDRGHRGDRDHRREKRREHGRDDRRLRAVTGAHRRLRRVIRHVIRAVAVRRIGTATLLDERAGPELGHRHRERDDDRDHDGRDPGRGAPDNHRGIRALATVAVNAVRAVRSLAMMSRAYGGDTRHETVPDSRSSRSVMMMARGSGRRARSIAAAGAASRDRSSRSPW